MTYSIHFNIYFITILLLCSCFTYKRTLLFQDQEADVFNMTGGLVKTLTLKETDYDLKPEHRIDINLFSLTEDKFNFMTNLEGKPLEAKLDSQGQVDLLNGYW